MEFPKVTFQMVTYNSRQYLPECLKSIFNQTCRDFQLLVIDNHSEDGTIEYLKKNYPEAAVFKNNKNVGFARAHNQGIKLLNSPYVVVCNPDIILASDWLEKIMIQAEKEEWQNCGLFGGKLLKLKVIDQELNETESTDMIDSCGLKILKSHQVVELGGGQKNDRFNEIQEVFGYSGALCLYKREALNGGFLKTNNNLGGEYFDEDFFSYKEDVDLSWRLQLFGFKALFVPQAVAYHIRSLSAAENQGLRSIIKNRRRQAKLVRYYSYRNHFSLLIKNTFISNLIKYFPQIFWYEFKKFIYVLFFERSSLKAIPEVIILLPKMMRKRKMIFKKIKVDAVCIGKWIL